MMVLLAPAFILVYLATLIVNGIGKISISYMLDIPSF